ncbi:hypothetical protein BC629DRAFT_1651846 [Irpex lacteus]|nr:hypothetical protein BC629DRAFT_1651846 [Irpex lacteus]
MSLSSHRVPPFFEESKIPATITMLMGHTELAPSGPNSLLLCSQELSAALPISFPSADTTSIRKRGRSLSRAPSPAGVPDARTPSRGPSRATSSAPSPPSRAVSIEPFNAPSSSTRTTRARSRARSRAISTTPPPVPRGRSRSASQPPKKQRRVQLRSPSPVLSDLTATETASGSDGMVESDETDDDDDTISLIPKPSGEAGRPGRGGYNLKDTLGWAANDYEDFKKKVDRLIHKHLDENKSFVKQRQIDIATVIEKAVESTPILMKYADHWPLTDLLKLRLKYMSSKGKKTRRVKKESK